MSMKCKHFEVSHEYETPVLTVITLEAESGMVLCASSEFEGVPEVDPDDEF